MGDLIKLLQNYKQLKPMIKMVKWALKNLSDAIAICQLLTEIADALASKKEQLKAGQNTRIEDKLLAEKTIALKRTVFKAIPNLVETADVEEVMALENKLEVAVQANIEVVEAFHPLLKA